MAKTRAMARSALRMGHGRGWHDYQGVYCFRFTNHEFIDWSLRYIAAMSQGRYLRGRK